MKAIITKTLFATSYKPTRIKVQAEGVPHIVVSRGDGTEEENHRAAALKLCEKYSWGTNLVSGGLPTPGQWVHCFGVSEVALALEQGRLADCGKQVAILEAQLKAAQEYEDSHKRLECCGCQAPAALVTAARVLATTYPQTSSQSLQVDAHAWECFKAELDKVGHVVTKAKPDHNKLAAALHVIVDNCGEDDESLDLKELCALRWSVKDCAKSALGLD